MARFRTLDDLDVRNKTVLLRADLNVPVKDGVVTDSTRIERLAPSVEVLIARGAKVVVMSHFGRPKDGPDPALSLRPLIAPLEKAIGGREVSFAADCIGEEAKRVVGALRPGQVALLENLRFHKGEESNSPKFARALAELGDLYVDDAFSAAHRAHASIAALAHLLPAAPGKPTLIVPIGAVPSDMMILDVGPKTVERIGAALKEARTLVWNGPLGAFETPPFDRGTSALAKRVAELTRTGKLLSIAGGGDTVAALAAAGVTDELSYVSTAGGAFLEWLEGRELPGVAALAVD